MRARWTVALLGLGLGLLGGCATPKDELSRVARDWCLTIRASQVIPVYPLTEDFQVGDVFLVETPVQRQAEIYDRKGFLPLDQHVTRLDGLGFDEFYRSAYWKARFEGTPHDPPTPSGPGGFNGVKAPRAAFPSYTFAVDQQVGLQIAIPVQGIPVGLGFLGGRHVTGSVTISDAYTYGIDGESLLRRLREWARQDTVRRELGRLSRASAGPIYLRVVGRVYLTGAVVVSMTSYDEASGGVDAGVPQKAPEGMGPMRSETPDDFEARIQTYERSLEKINDTVNKSLSVAGAPGAPGGSIRIAQWSERSITLKEQFDRLLVIGYVGFDLPIGPGGELGTPVATQSQLTGERGGRLLDFAGDGDGDGQSERLSAWLDDPANDARLRRWLADAGHDVDPADLLWSAEHATLRAEIIDHFGID